jgi:ketosteroid isomerase-like protein
VRFQTSETIPLQDPEIVLRVLETCLRQISPDVVRSGPEIILHGLGPSPRTVNQRDITILRVQAEPGRTVIDVDVTFQASAFLGEASQDDIVRSKLDRVFEQMKLQLSLEQMEQKRTPPSVLTQPPTETPSRLEAAAPISAPATQHPQPDIPPASPKTEPKSEPEITLQQSPPSRVQQPNQEFSQESSQALSHRSDASPTARRTGLLIAAAAALLLIASALYFLRPHPARSAPPVPSSTSSTPAAPPLAIKQDSSTTPAATPATPPAPPPSIPPPSTSIPTNADLKIWLEGWAAAMRTRDPAAQASFYADSVDRYLDRHNVSNAQILQDKKNAIHNRDGLWTVKLEDITLTQQTDTTAVVHLIKHYIPQTEPAQISEQLVHSRLELTRLNGQWKITSEQDLP